MGRGLHRALVVLLTPLTAGHARLWPRVEAGYARLLDGALQVRALVIMLVMVVAGGAQRAVQELALVQEHRIVRVAVHDQKRRRIGGQIGDRVGARHQVRPLLDRRTDELSGGLEVPALGGANPQPLDGQPVETLAGAEQPTRDRVAGLLLELVFRDLFEFGLIQTDQFGTSIADALRVFAELREVGVRLGVDFDRVVLFVNGFPHLSLQLCQAFIGIASRIINSHLIEYCSQ